MLLADNPGSRGAKVTACRVCAMGGHNFWLALPALLHNADAMQATVLSTDSSAFVFQPPFMEESNDNYTHQTLKLMAVLTAWDRPKREARGLA